MTTEPEQENEEDNPESVYLVEEMSKLPDTDLVKIGLTVMAILHQRACAVTNEQAEENGND